MKRLLIVGTILVTVIGLLLAFCWASKGFLGLGVQRRLPELYFLVVFCLWFFSGLLREPMAISYPPLIGTGVLIALLVLKSKTVGFSIAVIFVLLSTYLVLSLISDLQEVPFDNKSLVFLVKGVLLIAGFLVISGLMFRKYYLTDATIGDEG